MNEHALNYELNSVSGLVPGTFRPPMPQQQQQPYPGYGAGMPPPSPYMDPRTMALYGSMLPQMHSQAANPFYPPGLDPFRDPYR